MSASAAEVLARLAGDRLAPRAPLTLHQLAQGFLHWMEAHNWPRTSIESYGDALGKFLTFANGAGLRYLADVTVLVCDAFFAWLRERGASANTMAHRRSVLIAFWLWLEHEGFATTNVPRKTYPIKVPKRLPVYLEPHQIDAFLEKLSTLPDLRGRRDYAMVAMFFYAGVRVSELARLRLADVDLRARRIRVNLGKGAKDRVLVLPPRLVPVLRAYLDEVRPRLFGGDRLPWFFLAVARPGCGKVSRAAEGLLERAIFGLVRRRACELLGVRLSPHKLRHTCATYLLLNGAELETVQRHLGHEDVRTTMIYLHVPQRRQEEEIDRIFGRGEGEGEQ